MANSSLLHKAPTILHLLARRGKVAVHVLCTGAEQEKAFVVGA